MTASMTAPPPGSPEAIEAGCTCPVLDNGHGRGAFGDGEKYGYWMSESCPLHSTGTLPNSPRATVHVR